MLCCAAPCHLPCLLPPSPRSAHCKPFSKEDGTSQGRIAAVCDWTFYNPSCRVTQDGTFFTPAPGYGKSHCLVGPRVPLLLLLLQHRG